MDVLELLAMKLPVASSWSWLPEPASTTAEHVDWLFYFLAWTCGGLFLLVIAPLIAFAIHYKRRQKGQLAVSQRDHNTRLEVAWTALPVVYLTLIFHWGFVGYTKIYEAPVNAKQLRVEGKKWSWTVQYPDEDGNIEVGGTGVEIVVPVNQPVQLTMHSRDVLHSFFIPNFRVKQDVLPDRYSQIWFEATTIGEFPVLCAEYCGEKHSQMMAKIKVVSLDDYNAWVAKAKGANDNKSPLELGKDLYKKRGCNACHSVDGSPGIGPTFKGVYGHNVELANGTQVLADDNYIRESILEPSAKIVKGFSDGLMPKIAMPEKEIVGLIEFIKSFK
jgi:cytochrome c oxidase subunit 2